MFATNFSVILFVIGAMLFYSSIKSLILNTNSWEFRVHFTPTILWSSSRVTFADSPKYFDSYSAIFASKDLELDDHFRKLKPQSFIRPNKNQMLLFQFAFQLWGRPYTNQTEIVKWHHYTNKNCLDNDKNIL